MGFIKNMKDKKAQAKAEQEKLAEEERMNAEFEATYAAKMEKRKVEKMISKIEESEQALIKRAAMAKSKGYAQVYNQCVSFIKITRARKVQAEQFLFQMEAMQEMKSLSNHSAELLGSMQTIASTLGKLTLDKTAIMESQKNFAKTQQELEKQGMLFDQLLGGMETMLPEDSVGETMYADSDIDREIDAILQGSGSSSFAGIDENASPEFIEAQNLLKSLG